MPISYTTCPWPINHSPETVSKSLDWNIFKFSKFGAFKIKVFVTIFFVFSLSNNSRVGESDCDEVALGTLETRN